MRRRTRRKKKTRRKSDDDPFSFFIFSPGLVPQCPLEQSGAAFWVLLHSIHTSRLVGLKTNRPTIVVDLHRTLKGINKQTKAFKTRTRTRGRTHTQTRIFLLSLFFNFQFTFLRPP